MVAKAFRNNDDEEENELPDGGDAQSRFITPALALLLFRQSGIGRKDDEESRFISVMKLHGKNKGSPRRPFQSKFLAHVIRIIPATPRRLRALWKSKNFRKPK